MPLYVLTTIHVIASLPPSLPAITAAEFRIANWLDDPNSVIIAYNWRTPIVIGDDVGWGLSLVFPESVPGPLVELGSIELFSFQQGYPGVDHELCIESSSDSDILGVVSEDFEMILANGGLFTFNCSDLCDCWICYFNTTPVEETDWSRLKSLY